MYAICYDYSSVTVSRRCFFGLMTVLRIPRYLCIYYLALRPSSFYPLWHTVLVSHSSDYDSIIPVPFCYYWLYNILYDA